MSAAALKAWMDRHGKTEIDVASATGFNTMTVIRYLKGKSVHRSTEIAFKRLIRESNEAEDSKAAAG